MNSISIVGRALKALSLITSKDVSRYVLNSICVELHEHHAILIACDGRRFVAVRMTRKDGLCNEIDGTGTYILPQELPSLVNGVDQVSMLFSKDGKTVDVANLRVHGTFKLVEGNYPNWRSVVPGTPAMKVDTLNFNVELLDGIRQCLVKLYGPGNGGMQIRAHEPIHSNHINQNPYTILSTKSSEFFAVLMPLVPQDVQIPDWVKPKSTNA